MSIAWKYTLFLLIIIVPFGYAAFFCMPMADDFARANAAQGLFDWISGLKEVRDYWLNWSGRYLHHFMVIFLGYAVKTSFGYASVCLGVISIYLLALHGIFLQLCGAYRLKTVIFLAISGLATLLAAHQALPYTYYIVTDALGLGLGNALVLVHIWALCRLWYARQSTFWVAAFPCLTSILTIGCYEHGAIAALLASGVALWMACEAKHPLKRVFFYVMIVSIVFFLVSFLAPGNFTRQHVRNVNADLIIAQLKEALWDWIYFAPHVFVTPYVAYAILVGIIVSPCRQCADVQKISIKKILSACVLLFVSLSGMIIVVHALSDVTLGMASKLSESLTLLCAYLLVFTSIYTLCHFEWLLARLSPWMIILPFYIIVVLCHNTQATMGNALNGSLRQIGLAQEARQAVLKQSMGKDVHLAPFTFLPFPAVFSQIFSGDAAAWPNPQAAVFYDVRSVSLGPPSTEQALKAASVIAPLQWVLDSSRISFCLVKHVKGSPNETYDLDWLFLKAEPGISMPKKLYVVFTKATGYGVYSMMVKMIRSLMLSSRSFHRNWLTDCVSMPRDIVVDDKKVPENTGLNEMEAIVALPLSEYTTNEIEKVFISFDGKSYRQIAGAGI
jgi:hypothetical protein